MARRIEKRSIKGDRIKVSLPRLGINDKCVYTKTQVFKHD